MDLTGQWSFFEQFEAGFDMGYALLKQDGNKITGSLIYTEYIYDDGQFMIDIEVAGELDNNQLLLKGVCYTVLESPYEIEYCLDDRIAEISDPYRIEGHSVDDQDLEGRFVLRRLSLKVS
ncbi:hypothetical protein [Carboxylicivirga linearis]|uniref:Lipocalin-like domain-containing protein n=1 Tax=Carboxylicivirga linearis TaxID=1628157 RepID=A0ABS5JR19_9BACT|nr:hypothetical protein [Carboxylicivirga linearis]MBS2097277.1 hypothetical protein [Carboxylicivirga linearis]